MCKGNERGPWTQGETFTFSHKANTVKLHQNSIFHLSEVALSEELGGKSSHILLWKVYRGNGSVIAGKLTMWSQQKGTVCVCVGGVLRTTWRLGFDPWNPSVLVIFNCQLDTATWQESTRRGIVSIRFAHGCVFVLKGGKMYLSWFYRKVFRT